MESDKLLDIINGFINGRSINSKVLSSIRLLEKELGLSMLILLILPKNVIDVMGETLPDIGASKNVEIVVIPLTLTLMEREILHDAICGICAGLP